MNRQLRMIKTTGIYFIGNFASKLLAFFLLPLYTAYLTPEDFGMVDLITSTIPLIAPIFTMQVTESIFRFLCSESDMNKQRKVVTNSIVIFFSGILTFSIMYIPFMKNLEEKYSILFLIYFISVYSGIFLQQVLRGLQRNTEYALMGVISTFVQASLNIVLITKFNFGGESLLIASIVASITITALAAIKIKIWKYINFELIDKKLITEELKYGVPLIPNQICWWIIGLLGKYILLYFSGSGDNGILAVASKFPGLLTTVSSIFFLAWTENIIREFNSNDRDEYFSNSFKVFFTFSICAAACLLPVIKIYNLTTLGEAFIEAWIYVPILYIGALFNGFSSFLGTVYTASMKTKEAFTTTIFGAISNLIFSIMLTPFIGILGVVLANMLSFIVLFLSRIKSINKIINFEINILKIVKDLILIISSIFIYYVGGIYIQIIALIIFLSISIYINKNLISSLLSVLKRKKNLGKVNV